MTPPDRFVTRLELCPSQIPINTGKYPKTLGPNIPNTGTSLHHTHSCAANAASKIRSQQAEEKKQVRIHKSVRLPATSSCYKKIPFTSLLASLYQSIYTWI